MIHHHYYAYILAVACVLLSSVVNRNPAPSEGAHFSPQRRFKSETACLVSPSPYLLSVVIPTSPSPSSCPPTANQRPYRTSHSQYSKIPSYLMYDFRIKTTLRYRILPLTTCGVTFLSSCDFRNQHVVFPSEDIVDSPYPRMVCPKLVMGPHTESKKHTILQISDLKLSVRKSTSAC